MVSAIRNTINRLRWDKAVKKGQIVYVNRTSSGLTLEAVSIDNVTLVSKDYFRIGSGVTAKYIPYHRVVEIRCREGPIWKSTRWKTHQ